MILNLLRLDVLQKQINLIDDKIDEYRSKQLKKIDQSNQIAFNIYEWLEKKNMIQDNKATYQYLDKQITIHVDQNIRCVTNLNIEIINQDQL